MPYNIEHDRRYRCCLCLHVRTGTILIGLANICMHMSMIFSVVVLTMRNNHLPNQQTTMSISDSNDSDIGKSLFSMFYGIPPMDTNNQHQSQRIESLFGEDPMLARTDSASPDRMKNPSFNWLFGGPQMARPGIHERQKYSVYVELALNAFSFSFALLLVYGALTHRPTYLLPFMCLQVFTLVINLLTVVSVITEKSGICFLPKRKFGNVQDYTAFDLTFRSLAYLTVQTYFLGVILGCYNYLLSTMDGLGGIAHLRVFSGSNSLGRRGNSHTSRANANLLNLLERMGLRMGQPASGRDLGGIGSFRTDEELGDHRDGVNSGLRDYDAQVLAAVCRASAAEAGVTNIDRECVKKQDDLPAYDEALKVPINAHAPPPYFKQTNNKNQLSATAETTENENASAGSNAEESANKKNAANEK